MPQQTVLNIQNCRSLRTVKVIIIQTLKVSETFRVYEDIPGFCKRATLEEIRGHNYVLTPGRYVGVEDLEDDDEPFEEKFARLTKKLEEQFAESRRLEERIRHNLEGVEV